MLEDNVFRRRRRELFFCLVDGVVLWFRHALDATRRLGLFTYQKCTATLRMLAIDEYVRLGESTALEAMKRWVVAIHSCFGATYLRQPTQADFEWQIRINTDHGFSGMFASLDCMH